MLRQPWVLIATSDLFICH